NYHARAFLLKAFYAAAHAMRFLSFAHKKAVNWRPDLRTHDRGGNHNGIGAHGQAAHGISLPALLPKQIEKNLTGKRGTLRVQRGGAAVNVVIAFCAGGKSKLAEAERDSCQQIKKLFASRRIHRQD